MAYLNPLNCNTDIIKLLVYIIKIYFYVNEILRRAFYRSEQLELRAKPANLL